MAYGVQVYAADGTTLIFDSLTAVGGVVGDHRAYAAGAAGETINYPQWAGLTPMLIDLGGSGGYVAISSPSGYPVITVTSPPTAMAFALYVF